MQNAKDDEFPYENDFEESGPSKTKRKEHMEDLQKLGIELVTLSSDKLAKFELPDNLREAIKLAGKLTANGAIRRQNQYIGKLMRNVDEEYIKDKLDEVNFDSVKSTKLLHLCESWRERLLKNDNELDLFISQYPFTDIKQLRDLIRASKRDLSPVKTYRKLFKFIREIIETEKK